jgi:hypothetical protein
MRTLKSLIQRSTGAIDPVTSFTMSTGLVMKDEELSWILATEHGHATEVVPNFHLAYDGPFAQIDFPMCTENVTHAPEYVPTWLGG